MLPHFWQKRATPALPKISALSAIKIAVQEAPATPVGATMATTSFLSKVGKDFKAVFAFLGSSKGQAIVTAGEGVVEDVVPGSAGIINLANSWLSEIIKTESLAAAAEATTGSSAQKAAMVLTSVTPQALQFAQANGLSNPTAAQLESANTALVAFANAFGTTAA